jgi:phosphohistidine phosphatase
MKYLEKTGKNPLFSVKINRVDVMRQYFIRHGHAVERYEWKDDDMLRPLTEKGIHRMEASCTKFFSLYPRPNIIYSSEAVRSVQSAEILAKVTKASMKIIPLLNPGATPADYIEAISGNTPNNTVAYVGHEPDMTEFLSFYISGSAIDLVLKKGSICHLENRHIVNLAQQKLLLD